MQFEPGFFMEEGHCQAQPGSGAREGLEVYGYWVRPELGEPPVLTREPPAAGEERSR